MVSKQYAREYTRGSILDRNGETLVSSAAPLSKRISVYPNAFSNLIGYWSQTYGTFGVEDTLNEELTWSKSDHDKKRGADVTLTVDAELQRAAYRAIKGFTGSVTVLDAKTGEIMALASSPSFDVNQIEEDWDKIADAEGVFYNNAFNHAVAPGSVFKLVSSKAILEAGIQDEKVDDQGSLRINGQTIHNYDGEVNGKINYKEAFVRSSNVYFMDRILTLGPAAFSKAASDCLLGKEIKLDFTTLKSNFDLGNYEDNLVASTAFGQGETLVTPLHMAMITQSIAGDGTMLKPYLFKSIVNGKGNVESEGQTDILTTTMKAEIANQITDAMIAAGEKYGLRSFNGGKIAAKTGTAQRGNGKNNAWMVSFAPAEDPQYVVVVNKINTKDIGKAVLPIVESMYEHLGEVF